MVEPVRDRLADVQHRRQHAEALAEVGEDGLLRPAGLQVDVDLGRVDALGMLVHLGPAGAASDRRHLGHLADEAFGDEAEAVALGERDAGVVGEAEREAALVEGRQERPRQVGGRHARDDDRRAGDPDHQPAMSESPSQEGGVAALEQPDQPGVAMVPAAVLAKQVGGQDRRQGDRDDEARQDRDDVGDAERGEEAALDARQREEWHEDEADDQGRIDDARAHLLARRRDHLKHRLRLRPLPVLAQPPDDVLDIDHCVVDELADGDGQTPERHGVHRQA